MEPQKKENGKTEKFKTQKEIWEERIQKVSGGSSVGFLSRRWVPAGEKLGLLLLFLINLWMLLPFFGSPDETNVFSAPLLPILADLISPLASYAHAIRIVTLIFMIFFPISFFFFIKEISGRRLIGLLSSFLAVLPRGNFLSTRVNFGIFGGDAAYIASLTLTPLACLLLLRFLRTGSFPSAIFSAMVVVLIAVTSPMGLLVLLIFATFITFSEMLLGASRLKLLRHLTVLCLAAGFSAFWYNPKFIYLTIVSPQGQLIWKTFSNILPVSFFLVPLLGVFGFLLFENRAHLQALFISFFLTVGFGLLVAGLGFSTVSSSRFEPAFGISLAFLLGVGITLFLDYFKDSESLGRIEIIASYRNLLMRGMIAAIFLFFLFLFVSYGRSLFPSEERVLGFLIPEHGIGLWEIRERTSQGETLVGYAISALTGAGVGILRLKLRGA